MQSLGGNQNTRTQGPIQFRHNRSCSAMTGTHLAHFNFGQANQSFNHGVECSSAMQTHSLNNYSGMYHSTDGILMFNANNRFNTVGSGRGAGNLGTTSHTQNIGNLSVCASENRGMSASQSPFSNNASKNASRQASQGASHDTCLRVKEHGKYRYSSSPIGRLDIYETSETEQEADENQQEQDQLEFSNQVENKIVEQQSQKLDGKASSDPGEEGEDFTAETLPHQQWECYELQEASSQNNLNQLTSADQFTEQKEQLQQSQTFCETYENDLTCREIKDVKINRPFPNGNESIKNYGNQFYSFDNRNLPKMNQFKYNKKIFQCDQNTIFSFANKNSSAQLTHKVKRQISAEQSSHEETTRQKNLLVDSLNSNQKFLNFLKSKNFNLPDSHSKEKHILQVNQDFLEHQDEESERKDIPYLNNLLSEAINDCAIQIHYREVKEENQQLLDEIESLKAQLYEQQQESQNEIQRLKQENEMLANIVTIQQQKLQQYSLDQNDSDLTQCLGISELQEVSKIEAIKDRKLVGSLSNSALTNFQSLLSQRRSKDFTDQSVDVGGYATANEDKSQECADQTQKTINKQSQNTNISLPRKNLLKEFFVGDELPQTAYKLENKSDLSYIGLSGGDYSPISHTFLKNQQVPALHEKQVRGVYNIPPTEHKIVEQETCREQAIFECEESESTNENKDSLATESPNHEKPAQTNPLTEENFYSFASKGFQKPKEQPLQQFKSLQMNEISSQQLGLKEQKCQIMANNQIQRFNGPLFNQAECLITKQKQATKVFDLSCYTVQNQQKSNQISVNKKALCYHQPHHNAQEQQSLNPDVQIFYDSLSEESLDEIKADEEGKEASEKKSRQRMSMNLNQNKQKRWNSFGYGQSNLKQLQSIHTTMDSKNYNSFHSQIGALQNRQNQLQRQSRFDSKEHHVSSIQTFKNYKSISKHTVTSFQEQDNRRLPTEEESRNEIYENANKNRDRNHKLNLSLYERLSTDNQNAQDGLALQQYCKQSRIVRNDYKMFDRLPPRIQKNKKQMFNMTLDHNPGEKLHQQSFQHSNMAGRTQSQYLGTNSQVHRKQQQRSGSQTYASEQLNLASRTQSFQDSCHQFCQPYTSFNAF